MTMCVQTSHYKLLGATNYSYTLMAEVGQLTMLIADIDVKPQVQAEWMHYACQCLMQALVRV